MIASQALISGAFSLTRQAIQLGYCPRLDIDHTSATERGPDLHPASELGADDRDHRPRARLPAARARSAAAYGIAVTSTMVITTLLAYLVARGSWGVSRVVAGSLAGFFLAIELGFFGANLIEDRARRLVPARRRRPALHRCSRRGRRAARCSRLASSSGCIRFERISSTDIAETPPYRVPGTAIFMTSNAGGHAADAAPQPRAQQGAPRARHSADRR